MLYKESFSMPSLLWNFCYRLPSLFLARFVTLYVYISVWQGSIFPKTKRGVKFTVSSSDEGYRKKIKKKKGLLPSNENGKSSSSSEEENPGNLGSKFSSEFESNSLIKSIFQHTHSKKEIILECRIIKKN